MSSAVGPPEGNTQSGASPWRRMTLVPASLVLRPSWTPTVSMVLLVTGIMQDIVWMADQQGAPAHRGIGQIVATYTVGPPPHMSPTAEARIHECVVAEDITGLPLLQVSPVYLGGWATGCHVWCVRWLEGW